MSYNDDTTIDQQAPTNPDGPQTSAEGLTVYKVSQPLKPSDIAALQKNLGSGNVTVSPDGLTVSIQSQPQKSAIWQAVAIFGAMLATAGIAATVVGGAAAPIVGGTGTIVGAGGTTAAGGALAGVGAPLASTTIGTGAIPGIAGGTGLAGAVSTGSKLASLAAGVSKVGQVVGGVDQALHGGVSASDRGVAAANRADQAARNRFLETGANQNGTVADANALRNVTNANRMATYAPQSTDTPLGNFGKTPLTVSDAGRQFASDMQKNLAARMTAGKPLTLSGVPPKTPQEQADEDAALAASNGQLPGTGTLAKVGNVINTGSRLATLASQAYDYLK